MTVPYKLLMVDDNVENVRLIENELRKTDVAFVTKIVYLKQDFILTLEHFNPHIILANQGLAYDGLNAYKLMQQSGKMIPMITFTEEGSAPGDLIFNIDTKVHRRKADIQMLSFVLPNILKTRVAEDENRLLRERLTQATDDLKILTENYEAAREEEKLAISRELHDELGQILTALKIDINLLRKKVFSALSVENNETIESEFVQVLKTIDKSTQSVRKIASGLRPDILDKLGLIEAVEWLSEETSRRHGILCRTTLPKELPFSDDYYSVTIYRVVQEALTNILRHAEASEVLIEMTVKNKKLYLTITDNGKGISKEKMSKSTSLGLIGLRERVYSLYGQLNIRGNESKGTELSVIIPIDTRVKKEKV